MSNGIEGTSGRIWQWGIAAGFIRFPAPILSGYGPLGQGLTNRASRNGQALPGGLLSEQLGNRIFSVGGYVGEVLRQPKSGTWVGNDADPQTEINIELHHHFGR